MTTRQRIRDYIRENHMFGDRDKLSDQASLLSLGIIDSTGVLDLVSFLEDTLGCHVSDEDMVPSNLDSIDAIVAFVQRKEQANHVVAEASSP